MNDKLRLTVTIFVCAIAFSVVRDMMTPGDMWLRALAVGASCGACGLAIRAAWPEPER